MLREPKPQPKGPQIMAKSRRRPHPILSSLATLARSISAALHGRASK
jgi:hypothetical protein